MFLWNSRGNILIVIAKYLPEVLATKTLASVCRPLFFSNMQQIPTTIKVFS